MTLNLLRRSALATLLDTISPVVFDVGARGGLDEDFSAAAWCTTMVGFEPEPEEAARLAAAPDPRWRNSHVAPIALGSGSGYAPLYVPESPFAASLIRHNPVMVERYGHVRLHGTLRSIEVETRTLDDAVAIAGLPQPDYLKLDIEGAELGVLQSSSRTLAKCSALKVECAFIEQRLSQALAHEVIGYLAGAGFQLAEIRDTHSWRRRPIQSHPLRIRHVAPYSRGQIAQADLIFLRTPEAITDASGARRAIATAAVLGFIDHAVSMTRNRPDLVAEAEHLELGLLSASRVLGAAASRSSFAQTSRDWLRALRSRLNALSADRSDLPY